MPGAMQRVTFAVFIASTAIGTAHAVTDNAFNYSIAKTGHLTISTFAMQPVNPKTADYTMVENYLQTGVSSPTLCFITGINLPDRATITRVAIYYKQLYQRQTAHVLAAPPQAERWTTERIAEHTVTDSSDVRRVAMAPVHAARVQVINSDYSYGFTVCLGS